MAYQIDDKKCIKCGACAGVCPVGAIELKEDKYVIDPDKCLACGLCASMCSFEAPAPAEAQN